MLSFRCHWCSVSACLPCYLSKGRLKTDLLDIYLTTSFGVHKFQNTLAMKVIFFLKMSKLESKFKNYKKKKKKKKKSENIFRFWDNCISKCCYRLSLLTRENLLSAVNELTNSPKILHITQRDFFNMNYVHGDQ